jgi:ribosome-associated protein
MNKIRIPFSEFHFSFSRSSGAGGQNINKVNTKAILYWNIDSSPSCTQGVKDRFRARFRNFILDDGSVQIISQEHRTQKGNVDECIDKLHAMLEEVATPPKVRKATKPKRSAVLKRLSTKKKDSDKKQLRRKEY